MNTALWLIVLAGLLSIVYAYITHTRLMKTSAGPAHLQEISAAVREGAAAYLKLQYCINAAVGAVIFMITNSLLGM